MSADTKPRVLPLVYLLATLLIMVSLHYFVPIMQWLTPPASYIGIVLIIIGMAITIVSAGAFVKAGTPLLPFEKSTVVVQTGLYRFSRNPMYLGMAIALLGIAIGLGSIVTLIPIPVFAAIIDRQFICREERFLEGLFGEEYLTYKTKVRRWL